MACAASLVVKVNFVSGHWKATLEKQAMVASTKQSSKMVTVKAGSNISCTLRGCAMLLRIVKGS
jgi:hypothetical protein